jgi:hypothetical protein
MGLIAILLLFPAEKIGVLWVRGLSLQEYLASYATVPGIISLVMFLLFAAMPTRVTRLGQFPGLTTLARRKICRKLTIGIAVIRTGLKGDGP